MNVISSMKPSESSSPLASRSVSGAISPPAVLVVCWCFRTQSRTRSTSSASKIATLATLEHSNEFPTVDLPIFIERQFSENSDLLRHHVVGERLAAGLQDPPLVHGRNSGNKSNHSVCTAVRHRPGNRHDLFCAAKLPEH